MSLKNYEIITDKKKERFSVGNIEHTNLWGLYKQAQNSYWRAEEIDFSEDYDDFIKLSKDEQYVIEMILAFFANSDGIVNLNISSRILNEITLIEAKISYNFQMVMENIHNECYSLMLHTIIKDGEKRERLFNAYKDDPTIRLITDWALKWVSDDVPISKVLVAFASLEGILFSGSFSIVFWLKHHRSKDKICMPGLVKSNNFIARDEQLHCQFGCELYKMLNNKLSFDEIKEILMEAVKISQSFVVDTLKCKLMGMNADLMNTYIEYVCDHLAINLGYPKIYGSKNPFTWMETIGMVQKTNLHEHRSTEYQSPYSNKNMQPDKKIVANKIADDDF